jgi:peptidoglycan/xylan/chitin deacetylase (PgdA/CDA1 family)
MYLLSIVIILFIALSCRFNWWRQNKDGIPILMYHHIDNPPKDEKNKKLWISIKKFNQQMAYLKEHGYTSVTFEDLRRHIREGSLLPDHPVMITFDDAAENIYTNAFPILKKYGFKACLFMISEQSTLKVNQLKEMQVYGMEFGSHTKTHPNLFEISDDEIRGEILESKRILEEKLNTKIIVFAYPFGQGAYDERIKQIVKEGGYIFACGIKKGKLTLPINNPYSLNRLLIRRDDFMIDFVLNLKKGRSRL